MISLAVIWNGREDGEDTIHRAMKLKTVSYIIDYQLLSYRKYTTKPSANR